MVEEVIEVMVRRTPCAQDGDRPESVRRADRYNDLKDASRSNSTCGERVSLIQPQPQPISMLCTRNPPLLYSQNPTLSPSSLGWNFSRKAAICAKFSSTTGGICGDTGRWKRCKKFVNGEIDEPRT